LYNAGKRFCINRFQGKKFLPNREESFIIILPRENQGAEDKVKKINKRQKRQIKRAGKFYSVLGGIVCKKEVKG